jgi:hypothetical protein
VLDPVVGEALVHLVGHRDQVVLDAQLRDALELGTGEHGAGRVVRGVQQQQAGPRRDRGAHRVEVDREPAGPRLLDQRHHPPGGAGQRH